MTNSELIHIREIIDLRIKALSDLLEERYKSQEIALNLSTAEYHRRLDLLNGEAARLIAMQATYLPRESFENKFLIIHEQISELKEFRGNVVGRLAMLSGIISFVTTLLTAMLTKLVF